MSKKKEINIFIENTYTDFEQLSGIQLNAAQLTQDAIKMTEYFLSKTNLVENSCLAGYDFNLLYFDIVLTDNKKIHEINREYREKDTPTDVITFAIFADSPKEERFIFDNEINLGEVIISLDKALSQSKDESHENKTFYDELYFLVAHGILHLLGYDHKDEKTLKEMWKIQQEMISGCKTGRVNPN